jgi:putative methionine-R-sulfoxide reductase with GAF domain
VGATGNQRDYERAAAELAVAGSIEERMQVVVDILWKHLSPTGVSWVGFYTRSPGGQEMILGPCRDKPACSPIGLHGACGQVLLGGQPLVVKDVRDLGEGYVACDPRDQSEVVVPLFDEQGASWGVLDLDSHDLGSFDEADVIGLQKVLARAGFRVGGRPVG